MLRNHVNPALGTRTLRQVATDRDGVTAFLMVAMPANGLGASSITTAYNLIKAIVLDAVRAGKLPRDACKLAGIELPASPIKAAANFYVPTHAQLVKLAAGLGEYGDIVWIMRGCADCASGKLSPCGTMP
jgi:hypothetical protein